MQNGSEAFNPTLLAITQAIFMQIGLRQAGNRHRTGSPNRILVHKGFGHEFSSTFSSSLASDLLKETDPRGHSPIISAEI